MSSQLAYTHSANRQSSYPFTLFFTSLDGRTFDRLESLSDASYKRWSNTHWYPESYESMWLWDPGASTSTVSEPNHSTCADFDQNNNASTSTSDKSEVMARLPKASFVYLTADTEEELLEIKADEIYVIGGICDHNRYKVSRSTPQARLLL